MGSQYLLSNEHRKMRQHKGGPSQYYSVQQKTTLSRVTIGGDAGRLQLFKLSAKIRERDRCIVTIACGLSNFKTLRIWDTVKGKLVRKLEELGASMIRA